MKLSQALEATIRHVLPLPNHYLAVHFSIPPLSDDDEEEDEFRLIALWGVPSLVHLVGNWDEVRQVRIVSSGRGLAWPSGVFIEAHWLLLAPTSTRVRADRLMDLTAPVRRHKRTQMN